MAVYRLGDMIRMRREALGLTQDELIQIYDGTETEESERKNILESSWQKNGEDKKSRAESNKNNEICSTQVLRRIENGVVERAKPGIFRRLMMKMGLLPERIYAAVLVTECRALNLKSAIHVHICQKEYGAAEEKMQELETMLVPDYPRNRQYLLERRATLAYCQGKLSAEEYLSILQDALRCTVPKLNEIDLAGWPFNEQEFDILNGIATAYAAMGEKEKELNFLLKWKKNVEREYMDWDHYVVWHTHALARLSQFMCLSAQHDQSLEYCRIGLEECKKWKILGDVYSFLYDIAWNRENQVRKGDIPKEDCPEKKEQLLQKERAFCKKQLVQAYFLSVSQGRSHETERIKRLYEAFYPEAVKLP